MGWNITHARQQLYAVLQKNYILTFRNKRDFFREFGSPIFLVIILLLISRLGNLTTESIPNKFYPTQYIAPLSTLVVNKTILIAPCLSTDPTDRVHQYANTLQTILTTDVVTPGPYGQVVCLPNENALVNYYIYNSSTLNIFGGIIFDSPITYPISYRIRMNSNRYTSGYTSIIYNPPSIRTGISNIYPESWIPYYSPFLSTIDYSITQTIINITYPSSTNLVIPWYQLVSSITIFSIYI